MKTYKLKQKIKQGIIISLVGVSLSPLLSSTSVALAAEKTSNYTTISVSDLISQTNDINITSNLPVNKQSQLTNLKRQYHLSDEDTDFLKQQYLINHPNNPLESSKWKVAAVKKVVIPILKKFAKKARVPLGVHEIGHLVDILTGVEDNVQDRLYRALRHMGFSRYWASVTARAVVFILF